ncbi:MAG: polyprenyl synthetase family protein [Deltaproteobacteria bacterium]|nr:polyprenyl synthetase family protein [Deltaproteobacteria bacterium]
MDDRTDVARFLATCRREVEKYTSDWYRRKDGIPPILRRACLYALTGRGKRLRPALAIASCEACGGRRASVLPAACAVELIHTYSLVHDDLPCMDDDDFRRGRPTVHRVFGEAVAVLAGDALLSDAFSMALGGLSRLSKARDARRAAVVAELATAAGSAGMVGGQAMDIADDSGRQKSPAWMERMFALKTGRLIASAVRLGGVCSGAGAAQMRHLDRFGAETGLAFQITDDVLDAEAGKREPCNYAAEFGMAAARDRVSKCVDAAVESARALGGRGAMLESLARVLAHRAY